MRIIPVNLKTELIATSSKENEVVLVELIHPSFINPIRICRDRQDFNFQGNTYLALGFNISIPNDSQNQIPQASIEIDNVGRVLTRWLELSNGGADTEIRFIITLKSDPTNYWDYCASLLNIKLTSSKITGTIGYERVLNKDSVNILFRPETHVGLF